MLTPRDVEKVLSLLRRVYGVIVIDMSSHLNDINLAFLDASDAIIEIVTYDSTTIHNTIAMADTFRSIGYPASKVRYLVNRADSPGGIDADRPRTCPRPRPGAPRRVRRPARGPVEQRGRAVRAGQPRRARSARTSCAWPASCCNAGRAAAAAGRSLSAAMSDPRPIGVFDSGVGGLTVLREIVRRLPGRIDDLPRRQRPRAVRRATRTRRSSPSRRSRSTSSPSATSRPSSSPATPRPRSRIGALRRRYDLPILGVIRPGASAAALATRNRRVGVIATPATIRSHAYFSAIKDENPAVEVYEHATPTLVPLVEAGELTGPTAEAAVAEALAPLLGERDAAGEFDLPAAAGGHDRHAAARLHPLPAAAAGHRGRGRRRRRDRRLGHGHGVRARRAAGHQRPRGGVRRATGDRDPPPADDRRPGHVPRPGRPAVRRGVPGRRARRARGRRPDDRPSR